MIAAGMKSIAEKYPIGAAVSMMDLSVEAECFGAKIRFFDDDVPTVEKGIIEDISEAKEILVPAITDKRAGVFIEGIKSKKRNTGYSRILWCYRSLFPCGKAF